MNTIASPRGQALAARDASIQQNVAKIEEAKARPTAIQAMAARLNLSPAKLQETLRQTVFREANDAEFAALIVVANEYKLNPLLKEIYAFKAKGGGIIPYVSVDGWIRIINEHPQFDGIDFNDIVSPEGEIEAIECVIFRKDRSRPIKIVEYMDECRRDTDPWRKSPKRFLRHRSIMQCGRVAFGFSGIGAEDDYEIIPYASEPINARNITPSREQGRQQIAHDPETGEVLSEEETAELDRRGFAQMEGRDDADMGEAEQEEEGQGDLLAEAGQQRTPAPAEPQRTSKSFVDDLLAKVRGAQSTVEIQQIQTDNADALEELQDKAPRQYERWIEGRDNAWAEFD